MALQPGRYIGHFLGLASDGKPIYAVYCCVPDTQSDSDLPSFVSVSESTSDSGSWDSFPPSSYPDSGGSAPAGGGGGVPCTDCLSRLCVVRDDAGRIVDIYYYTDSGDYVRVPDCGYYGSAPSSSDSSGGSSGGGGGGGSGDDICCPPGDEPYVVEYNITVNGQTYSGVTYESYWSGTQYGTVTAVHSNSDCNPPYLFLDFLAGCLSGVNYGVGLWIRCGFSLICYLATPDDIDKTITGCPGLPTFQFTIKSGRCASGSFTIRPA